ncbi:Eco29kI family restriction endonuclease [Micromonospora sp. LOL_028]|uniref:Eco29kI family restriction endonuclease n=1 Tax=unclassified Micromonospora TaxID=2617518 RepID=UPI003A8B4842
MSTWTAEFRLSITKALADQLEATLRPLTPATLDKDHLERVQSRPGVYCLFHQGRRVYVGKAAKSLQERLNQHQRKVTGRAGLDPADIRFVCVYVDEDLDAAAPEKLLIKNYRTHDSIPWNTNGFGNNDPGRNRDGSKVRSGHFDALYPVDLDFSIRCAEGVRSVDELLEQARTDFPFRIRWDSGAAAKAAYQASNVRMDDEDLTVRAWAARLVAALPEGWQLTALPGYLILYREERRYESALGWWRRSADGSAQYTQGPKNFAAGPAEDDPAEPGDLDQGP